MIGLQLDPATVPLVNEQAVGAVITGAEETIWTFFFPLSVVSAESPAYCNSDGKKSKNKELIKLI